MVEIIGNFLASFHVNTFSKDLQHSKGKKRSCNLIGKKRKGGKTKGQGRVLMSLRLMGKLHTRARICIHLPFIWHFVVVKNQNSHRAFLSSRAQVISCKLGRRPQTQILAYLAFKLPKGLPSSPTAPRLLRVSFRHPPNRPGGGD